MKSGDLQRERATLLQLTVRTTTAGIGGVKSVRGRPAATHSPLMSCDRRAATTARAQCGPIDLLCRVSVVCVLSSPLRRRSLIIYHFTQEAAAL